MIPFRLHVSPDFDHADDQNTQAGPRCHALHGRRSAASPRDDPAETVVVNEAWIAFRHNSAPIRTERDGDFNCIALMDAASCFLLASDLFSLRMPDADQLPIRRLLTQAKRHKQQFPKTLFVPKGDAAEAVVDEALRQKIHVVSVPESEVLIFIDEARQGFMERFGDGREDA
jgi:hypothetical protein